MRSPGRMGGRGRSSGQFPLNVEATLMRDEVIEAGLEYYSEFIGMSPSEKESFAQSYRERHNLNEYILIEIQLRTTWAENYLDLNRWTIFIEDDQGNQNEPSEIAEEETPAVGDDFSHPFPSKRYRKTLFLYFKKYDIYGQQTLPKDIEFLKIIFLLG